MELPNSETDNNDNVSLLEKNKNKDVKEDKNPLIVAPLQSEKVTIIVKSPMLKDKESLSSQVEDREYLYLTLSKYGFRFCSLVALLIDSNVACSGNLL